MTDHTAAFDEVTASACRWLLEGAEPGRYCGPVPDPGHDLACLLARETGRRELVLSSEAVWVRRMESLRPVTERLHAAGADLRAAKGFDLAQCLYSSPGARPMSDVDLYVRQRDIAMVISVFRMDGWSVSLPGRGLLDSGVVSEVKLLKNDLIVELHTHVFYFPALFPGRLPRGLFEGGRELEPCLRGFPWPFGLLLAVLQVLSGPAVRPAWWTDICLLCREVDRSRLWREFTRYAWMTRLGPQVSGVLEEAVALGAPVPPGVLRVLRESPAAGYRCLAALRQGRRRPSVMNLLRLTGWRRVSWFYALLWMTVSRRDPMVPEQQWKGSVSLRGRSSSS